MTNKYNLIIWDFNGTLANDVTISLNAINVVLSKRNLKLLENEDSLRNMFCFPCRTYYEKLGLDFSKEPYEVPADEWVAEYNKHIDEVELNEGIVDVLEYIKSKNIPQIILSASEINMLNYQVDKLDIRKYFDCIIGTDNVYAKGKIDAVKEWLKTNKISSPFLFIGDTDHDYYCSKEINCDCLLYSNGFMSHDRLSSLNTNIVKNINDIINYI